MPANRNSNADNNFLGNIFSFHILIRRTCEVDKMGENSSFIFTCYVKTIPVYSFKLVWVVLHPSVKDFFKTIYLQVQNNDVLFIESF